MPKRGVSPDKVEEIVRLAKQGVMIKVIAIDFGLSGCYVSQIVSGHRRGNAKKERIKNDLRQYITDKHIEIVIDLRNKGLVYREIKEKTGISIPTICKIVKENECKINSDRGLVQEQGDRKIVQSSCHKGTVPHTQLTTA